MEIPWWYYAIAAAIGLTVWKCWRWESGLFSGYAFLLIAETLLTRQPFEGQHFQPELFWSWRAWSVQRNQILTNLVMFIPVGVISGRLWKWRGLWVAAGLSVVIEVLQLVTRRGLMEFDDVIHNCLGAGVGVVILMLISKISRAEETE